LKEALVNQICVKSKGLRELFFESAKKIKLNADQLNLNLKMLGLYLHTLIFSYKSCKMLSILNKLILQKDVQNIVTNNVFMDKK